MGDVDERRVVIRPLDDQQLYNARVNRAQRLPVSSAWSEF